MFDLTLYELNRWLNDMPITYEQSCAIQCMLDTSNIVDVTDFANYLYAREVMVDGDFAHYCNTELTLRTRFEYENALKRYDSFLSDFIFG